MTKEIIHSDQLLKPIGPYSIAVKSGDLVFTSGQIPIEASTQTIVSGGIGRQTAKVLENLKSVLIASGTSMDNVIKTTVFLKDMNDFTAMNEVYAQFFSSTQAPARSTVEVARLPKDVLIEIEAVASMSI